jgi:hypothetical protein
LKRNLKLKILREQIETEENMSQQKTKEHKPPISHNFGWGWLVWLTCFSLFTSQILISVLHLLKNIQWARSLIDGKWRNDGNIVTTENN